tara:strand:+ start:2236 stop:3165 length:930 start_codon:yes stop_codon:yes gene_type:complete
MTVAIASGYQNLGNGNFVPTIYSQKVLKFFRRASVVEDITNTDYTGEIENYGDTVNIINEPTVTVSSYYRGSVVNAQTLTDAQTTLTVDQAFAFSFKVDDIEERHSHLNWESIATSSGAYALKKKYDYNVLNAMISGASTDSGLGTSGSGIAGVDTGDEASDLISKAGRLLDQNDVPQENRWYVGSPILYEVLSKSASKLMDQSIVDSSKESPLRNGKVIAGPIRGFTMYKTNVFDTGTAGTDEVNPSGSNEYYSLAGHMSSTATASHIAKTEVVRDTDSFADIVRGLHVFGRKVLRSGAVFSSTLVIT